MTAVNEITGDKMISKKTTDSYRDGWDAIFKKEKASRDPKGIVTDPDDPRLTHGTDEAPRPQAEVYLVLSDEERAKGFVRPVRNAYRHLTCGTITRMGQALAETYAREPSFYGGTYCVQCSMHRPVTEFVWDLDGSVVGS